MWRLDWNGVRWGDPSADDEAGISDWNFVKWGEDTTIPELPEPPLTLADGDINGDNFVGSGDLGYHSRELGCYRRWRHSVHAGTWDGDALPQDFDSGVGSTGRYGEFDHRYRRR